MKDTQQTEFVPLPSLSAEETELAEQPSRVIRRISEMLLTATSGYPDPIKPELSGRRYRVVEIAK